MKKKLLSILLIAIVLIGFTGCGSDDKKESKENSGKIASKLNKVVKSDVDKWKDKGYAHTFSLSDIQSTLEDEEIDYIFIASGNEKFTKAPDSKKYTDSKSDFKDYDGKLYGKYRMLEEENEVNYVIVLDTKTEKYYSLKIKYKTTKLNDVEKEYPYFESETKLK